MRSWRANLRTVWNSKAPEDDLRTYLTVIRCLEVVSEASRRLPAEFKEQHPGIDWRNIAASGNVYRHEYESVDLRLAWLTVRDHLPALKVVAEAELRRLDAADG
jgi:uncharacterized protein with HEPN domain